MIPEEESMFDVIVDKVAQRQDLSPDMQRALIKNDVIIEDKVKPYLKKEITN